MIKLIKYLFLLIPSLSFGQNKDVEQEAMNKFANNSFEGISSTKELAGRISEISSNAVEQLQLLLLWADKYMEADQERFFNGNTPISPEEAIKARKGLCEDYAAILDKVCGYLKIPAIRIEGYVRETGFKPKDHFKTGNHVWNAVLIDSTWKLCDLFWSTTVLKHRNGVSAFEKIRSTQYYIVAPGDLIATHLPFDPVFQFNNNPIKIEAFTNVTRGVDVNVERLPFCNYLDSITSLQKLPEEERSIRIARNAYRYNVHNPNVLIAAYYNDAVTVLNNSSAGKADLERVKTNLNTALTLIEGSDNPDIQSLATPCEEGIEYINKRL